MHREHDRGLGASVLGAQACNQPCNRNETQPWTVTVNGGEQRRETAQATGTGRTLWPLAVNAIVTLITRRSQVQILPPPPNFEGPVREDRAFVLSPPVPRNPV